MPRAIVAHSFHRYAYQRTTATCLRRGWQRGVTEVSKFQSFAQLSHFTSSSDDVVETPDKRIHDIRMNPKSISSQILPGDYIFKKDERTGKERKVLVDRAYGYFWMMKDLGDSDNKPILANESLIPAELAQEFPPLSNLENLLGEKVGLPEFFLRNNRASDPEAQCTLVAISFKDHGHKLLPSWTDPFEDALCNDDGKSGQRTEVIKISITEGWFLKMMRSIVISGFKSNTREEDHESTLLGFGSDMNEFRDILRMHNTMTGYVYLLDGLGRVRFAGSGKATPEEAEMLVSYARKLTPHLNKTPSSKKQDRARAARN